MNSAFPFSIPVSVQEGAGSPVTVQAPWTDSLSSLTAAANAAVVLYNDFGSDAAGLYISFNNRWNFAAPYATVSNFIVSGGTINVYVGLTSTVTPEVGATVFRNGIQSTATELTASSVTWATVLLANSAGYQLPVATASVLGGVKQGSGVTIAGDGTLSATGTSYTLPAATTSTLGGVIVGSGINVSAGTISVTPYTLPSATTSVLGGVIVGSGITLTGSTISVTPYTLPAATTSALGGVIVGAGLSVTSGTVSTTVQTVAGVSPTAGNVPLAVANITGAAPLASPTFTGTLSAAAVTITGGTQAAAITASGLITANGGITVPTGETANFSAATSVTVPTLTAGTATTGAASTAFVGTAVSAGHGQPYDVVMPYLSGLMTDNQVLLSYVAPRPLTFAAGGALSWAWATVAATAAVSCAIKVGATTVGTLTWAAAATEGIVNFTAATNMTAGQILTITAPATADTTLADITLTLGGALT